MDARAQLTNAYKQYLGRDPEAGQIDWRVGLLGSKSLASQINDIRGSAEAKSYASRGSSPSGNVSQPLFDFAASQKNDMNALLERQKAEQQGLFDKYTGTLNNQEQLPALYKRLQTEAGIPDLSNAMQGYKTEIYRVKGLLDRLDEGVNSRNRGTYTTQGLRDRIANVEGTGLRTDLSRLGTGMEPIADLLTSAQNQVGTMLNLNIQQQEKALKPLEIQINSISDRFAREMTGFNQNRENQLTAITDKLTRERELSDREWELAQQLAAEERAYARQRSLAATSLGSYLTGGNNDAAAPAAPAAPSSSAVRELPALTGNMTHPMYGKGLGIMLPPTGTSNNNLGSRFTLPPALTKGLERFGF